ncbi:unnamed protein product, partial [Allacma fusca]
RQGKCDSGSLKSGG